MMQANRLQAVCRIGQEKKREQDEKESINCLAVHIAVTRGIN